MDLSAETTEARRQQITHSKCSKEKLPNMNLLSGKAIFKNEDEKRFLWINKNGENFLEDLSYKKYYSKFLRLKASNQKIL